METFRRELKERIEEEMRGTLGLEEGEDVEEAAVATIASAVKKRTAATMTHCTLVKAGPYAFIQWEDGYERKNDEQEAWLAA